MHKSLIQHDGPSAQGKACIGDLLAAVPHKSSTVQLSVAFTVIEAGAGCVAPSKAFGLDGDGNIVVTSSGSQPSTGLATRREMTGKAGAVLSAAANVLNDLTPRQAIVCAPPPPERAEWTFVANADLGTRPGTIARTQEFFPAPAGNALFGLDFDVKAWPRELQERVFQRPGQVLAVLESVASGFLAAASLHRASSSAGVLNPFTGAQTDGNSGLHIFFVALRGGDVKRAVTALHQRLILNGWGYGFVTDAGTVLVRSLIDVTAASDLSRLWFEGRVQLADGLELIPESRAPAVVNPSGGPIDTASIAELNQDEQTRLAVIEDAIRASCCAEAEIKSKAWNDKQIAKMVAEGTSPDRAAIAARAACEQRSLEPEFIIELDDGGTVTVGDIYADRMAFHGKTCADPLEPEYGGGRNKAVIYTDGPKATIFSHAHGGILYNLESTEWFDASAAVASAGNTVAPTNTLSAKHAPVSWIAPVVWEGSSPKPQEWEVENWIPRHEVTLLYGDGGVGKTLLAHQYATAAATGRKWLGQPTRAARIMCFFCEDDNNELHRRQSAINQSLGLAMDDLTNLRLVSRKHDLNLLAHWDVRAGELKLTPLWHQLRDDALAFGATVIIIDTIADVYAGNEIDRAQVSAFVKLCLGGLAQAIGGSVIALGHPSQSGKNSGEGTSGSTAWNNSARSRIYLKRPETLQSKNRRAGAVREESGNVRELENMKLNYGPKGSKLKLEWRRGAFVPLGGSSPTSGAVDAIAEVPDLDDAAERAVAEAIAACAGVRLTQFQNSPYYAPKILKRQAAGILKAWSLGEIAAAFETLVAKSAIREIEIGRTPDRKAMFGFEIAPVAGQEIDNLSSEVEPCASVFL